MPVRPALIEEVGRRVRELRHDRRLTLDELAARSGVSRRMITLLEAGSTNASLGTLDKLARALGTDFPSLVTTRPAPALAPGSSREVDPLWEDARGSSARLLVSHGRTATTEVWAWQLGPHARYDADADPPGSEETILVSSGTLVVTVAGAAYRVAAGGYLRLPTDEPYAYVNPGSRTCRFVRVVATP